MQSNLKNNFNLGSLTVSVGNCEVLIIPSFHYRLEFGYAVHDAFKLNLDIDAVAVELMADMADNAVSAVKRHLSSDDNLPGVLSLYRNNTESCEYLPLCPGDSIIEAVRLAVVHRLPLYGVDLDVFGGLQHLEAEELVNRKILPDPASIKGLQCLADYMEDLQGIQEFNDFGETDLHFAPRNLHMARKLLWLATKYKRILFICGMAHFKYLRKLLLAPETEPLDDNETQRLGLPILPAILDPTIAYKHLKPFPRVVKYWQEAGYQIVNQKKVFEDALLDALHDCEDDAKRKLVCFKGITPREFEAFKKYLNNLKRINGVEVPTIGLVARAAKSTIPRLTATLIEKMMNFPWLNKEDFPYPCLKPGSCEDNGNDEDSVWIRLGDRGFKNKQFNHENEVDFTGSDFDRDEKDNMNSSLRRRTFPVDDRISTIIAVRIAEMESLKFEESSREYYKFEETYNILSGVDVRRTVRSIANGIENPLIVFEQKYEKKAGGKNVCPYPIVFIFNKTKNQDSTLFSWYAPLKNKDTSLQRINYHGLVGFGTTVYEQFYSQKNLDCVVHFLPLIYSDPQYDLDPDFSSWDRFIMIKGNEDKVPTGISSICSIYPDLAASSDPAHDIVTFTYNFTDHCSVVIMDPALRPSLEQIARRKNKEISIYDAVLFPEELIQRVRMPLLVDFEYENTTYWRGGKVAKHVENLIGESQYRFADIDFSQFAIENLQKGGRR